VHGDNAPSTIASPASSSSDTNVESLDNLGLASSILNAFNSDVTFDRCDLVATATMPSDQTPNTYEFLPVPGAQRTNDLLFGMPDSIMPQIPGKTFSTLDPLVILLKGAMFIQFVNRRTD
jgi:hypothetical protein